MKYDERLIDQVQSASDIVETISQYLTLKRSGRNLKACCPFHSEKSPSFMVQPEKQIFHCFGCGAGGDVFTFLMKHENMSFPEALRLLAERAGIDLPKPTSKDSGAQSEVEELYAVYQAAWDYYHALFNDASAGRIARDYFVKRGFPIELAAEIRMGWAPEVWRGLLEYLTKKGFKDTLLLKAGLVSRSPKGQIYDAFRGRLLFPIQNMHGKVIGFGGRILTANDQGPKYLNSPESPIFQKRRELFGLHLAKKGMDRDRRQMIVVEGYFGFLRLYHAGFKGTVATLGTSLTEDHVRVLKRFADEAVVVYDGDKAGEAAALRGLEVFLEGEMNVKIAKLPSGLDPDDFVLKYGAEAFQALLDEARDFFDYKLEILSSRHNRFESLGLMRLTGDFLETFSKIQNPVLLDHYLRRLASALGVDENSLRSELAKIKKKSEAPSPLAPAGKAFSSESPTDEILMLFLAIEEPRYREMMFTEISETDFNQAAIKNLFHLLAGMFRENQKIDWPKVLQRIPEPLLKQKFTALSAVDWEETDKDKAFGDCLRKIQRRRVEKRLEDLRRKISQAEHQKDQPGMAALMEEYQSLWRESKIPLSPPGR